MNELFKEFMELATELRILQEKVSSQEKDRDKLEQLITDVQALKTQMEERDKSRLETRSMIFWAIGGVCGLVAWIISQSAAIISFLMGGK